MNVDPTPRQQGAKAAAEFGANYVNPFPDGTENHHQYRNGWMETTQRLNRRAIALLSCGAAMPILVQRKPQAWGAIMADIMTSDGTAMATIYLGAELMHRGLTAHTLGNVPAKVLLEIAGLAARGQDLPRGDVYHTAPAIDAHDIALGIREFVTEQTNERDGKSSVQVNAQALMVRIQYHDNPPPEHRIIIPSNRFPPGSSN